MGKWKRACKRDLKWGEHWSLVIDMRSVETTVVIIFAIIAVTCNAHRLTEQLAQQKISK